jgi:Protein of unknown function (DUF3035)
MFRRHPVRGVDRGVAVASALCLAASSLIAGCTDFKKSIGLEPTLPDEFAVESRAPLTLPPDFELRPPSPGAPRPQEMASNQQAKQAIEQAGPGEPGKQAPDFRLRRSEDGLPDIGRRSAQAPDPAAAVGDQSLSSKLLGYDGASGGSVEKRETTPLKSVY